MIIIGKTSSRFAKFRFVRIIFPIFIPMLKEQPLETWVVRNETKYYETQRDILKGETKTSSLPRIEKVLIKCVVKKAHNQFH
jgi:hypothetical protein